MKYYHWFYVLCFFILAGCESNKYEEHYSVISDTEHGSLQEEPIIIEIISKKQLNKLMHDDRYVLIGKSEFTDFYYPRTYAIDCAKKHGAALIAVECGNPETIEYDSVDYIPTTSTTYHSGSILDSSYYGGYYNYSGTSTTYGSTPIVVKRHKTYYPQTGYFFAKNKNNNTFGVSFQLPDNIPGTNDTSIKVLSVKKGSQAEKLCIRKNDIVKSINGQTISSPNDVLPYINGTKTIKTIKVSHE